MLFACIRSYRIVSRWSPRDIILTDWSSDTGLFLLLINAIVTMTTSCSIIISSHTEDCIVDRVDDRRNGRRRHVWRVGLCGTVQMAAQGRTRLVRKIQIFDKCSTPSFYRRKVLLSVTTTFIDSRTLNTEKHSAKIYTL